MHLTLQKRIPIGSGLGGGSSNAAHILKILNTLFSLNLGIDELISYSKKIGSDCPFFLINSCSLISGTGDVIKPLSFRLNFDFIVILKPDDILSTKEVFTNFRLTKNIKPYEKNDINNLDSLKNDLETTSEKMAMGSLFDGKATLVTGTHTHVPTNDARVMSEGS